jgi:hypothetical protein
MRPSSALRARRYSSRTRSPSPGTTHEHLNWRHRLPVSLEELKNHAALRSLSEPVSGAVEVHSC